MKKHIWILLIGVTVLSLLAVPGCKRSNVTDPDMIANDSYQINLSGIANPSTLLITQGCPDKTSQITMTAIYNNGEPIAGKQIIMKINDEIGFFPGGYTTTVISTNSSGKAYTTYTVSHFAREKIGHSNLIYLDAYLQTDLNPLYGVHDMIPIQLITDIPDIEVDTLAYVITGSTSFGASGGEFSVFLYNSTGTASINYVIGISDTSMITSPAPGTSGATESDVTFTVSKNDTSSTRTATITITATADGIEGSPITITVTQGASNNTFACNQSGNTINITAATGGSFSAYLSNSTDIIPINYTISIVDSNKIITSPSNGTNGTTPYTQIFNVRNGIIGWTAVIKITATSPADVAGVSHVITVVLN